ncbi:MAG TPA: hypothetical protein VGR55_00470 [Candidatus Acidoferrum sp.]|nr:hypothetical protein [Candidatus Acidoferrum sp.]
MATLKLTTPTRIGDLNNGITIDALDLKAISVSFQRASAEVSIILQHSSGWTHNLVLRDSDGDSAWIAIKGAFPNFEKQILTLLAPHLPAGSLS